MNHPRRFGECVSVRTNVFERGNLKGIVGWCFGGAEGKGCTAEITEVLDGLSGVESTGDFDDPFFSHTVDQQVGLAVEQDRPTHFVAPIVVVSEAPEGRFDPACNHWNLPIGLPCALAVGQRRAIRSQADLATWRIRIIVTYLPVGGVVVDHRVHVSGADREEESRTSKACPVMG